MNFLKMSTDYQMPRTQTETLLFLFQWPVSSNTLSCGLYLFVCRLFGNTHNGSLQEGAEEMAQLEKIPKSGSSREIGGQWPQRLLPSCTHAHTRMHTHTPLKKESSKIHYFSDSKIYIKYYKYILRIINLKVLRV